MENRTDLYFPNLTLFLFLIGDSVHSLTIFLVVKKSFDLIVMK